MSDCDCENGFVMHELPGGARQMFRCPCPKGDPHKTVTKVVGRGKNKRTVTYQVLTRDEAVLARIASMPLKKELHRITIPSGRDLATGEKE